MATMQVQSGAEEMLQAAKTISIPSYTQLATEGRIPRLTQLATGGRILATGSDEEISTPDRIQIATRGCIGNHTNTDINLYKEKIWFSGVVLKPYPNTIKAPGYHGSFIHIAEVDKGSMEAVIYSGLNNYGKSCGWLLAWYAPWSTNSKAKVYVECGDLENFEPINWNRIESKLLGSGRESRYMDKCTSTTVHALIESESGIASIGACCSAYN